MSKTSKEALIPGTEAWSIKIRKRAKKIIKYIDQGYMELASIIHTVWSTPIDNDPNNACVTVAWGYSNYVEWAEEELGIQRRKTERLKGIWHHLYVTLEGQLSLYEQRKIIGLGWTKVRELIRVIDGENAEKWIEVAENLSHRELVEVIKATLEDQEKLDQAKAVGTADEEDDTFRGVSPPEDVLRFKQFLFALSPEQAANVQMALDRAEQLANSQKRGHLLDLICTDFLSTNDFKKKDDPHRHLIFLAKFERLMGRRLVVVDPINWVIEYGMETLAKVAESMESNDDRSGADATDYA